MAEVEYMTVAKAVAFEDRTGFALDRRGRRQQHCRVEISLQGRACADACACFAYINRPVQADSIATGRSGALEPSATALGEHDVWYSCALVLAFQSGDHARGIAE